MSLYDQNFTIIDKITRVNLVIIKNSFNLLSIHVHTFLHLRT